MYGTIYSYKPATASGSLEGASTVLALKTGELLELRRGETTRRWSAVGGRRKWASLDEWKATLPADAVINIRAPEEDTTTATASTDFARVSAMLAENRCAAHLRMTLYTNRRDAEKEKVRAKKYRQQAQRCYYGEALRLLDAATACEARAAEILAKEPYKRFVSGLYQSRIFKYPCGLMAQRTTDGVFVPLFLDPERKVFHTQADSRSHESRVGATLAELGLGPTFLVRAITEQQNQRLVTL
jgi:hypothetical protein